MATDIDSAVSQSQSMRRRELRTDAACEQRLSLYSKSKRLATRRACSCSTSACATRFLPRAVALSCLHHVHSADYSRRGSVECEHCIDAEADISFRPAAFKRWAPLSPPRRDGCLPGSEARPRGAHMRHHPPTSMHEPGGIRPPSAAQHRPVGKAPPGRQSLSMRLGPGGGWWVDSRPGWTASGCNSGSIGLRI